MQPVHSTLQHAAGFARDDTPDNKRAKLKNLLAPGEKNDGGEIELFAELLGLAASPALAAAERDPQASGEKSSRP